MALDPPRSWSPLAQAGVSPAAFVCGRHVLAEACKSLLALVAYACLVVPLPAGPGAGGGLVARRGC